MTTPIEGLSSLVVGTVESVSPREFKVILDTDAPQTTAMNAGIPRGFPRINGYILIPNEQGAVVGLISWIGIERSLYPKRTGLKDFGLIDLPFPTRKLSVVPIGTLGKSTDSRNSYELRRGISIFPSVGDKVCIPTIKQLRSIVEASGSNKRVIIGKAPLAENAPVSIDPDKIFGRHLAILGNTGSGKSCSVAGIIRWSLEEAQKEKKDEQEFKRMHGVIPEEEQDKSENINARFIILDPNGEYSHTFTDIGARIYKVQPESEDIKQLKVPAWLWNSHEWGAFARASSQVQKPLLSQALKGIREGQSISDPLERRLIRVFKGRYMHLGAIIGQGPDGYSGFPARQNCGIMIENILKEAEHYYGIATQTTGISDDILSGLNTIKEICKRTIEARKRNNYFNDFSEPELTQVYQEISNFLGVIDTLTTVQVNGVDADSPISFNINYFPEYLETLAAEAGGGTATNIQYLIMRIKTMLADRRFNQVVAPQSDSSFEEWLASYIGQDQARNGPVAVIDLSLVPSDLLHIIAAVIARIVFEAVQRYKKLNQGMELPTVLVLEEAHTFIKRNIDDDQLSAASLECRKIFERIAREGRKFGLGLVLSSQRPSELSPTVLSQCNTFLLHRIVNDRDQELVSKLVPDNLGGLLAELPSLPSGEAILMGWASPIPVLVKMKELPKEMRPESSDPKYWSVWVGAEERRVDWTAIAEDWRQ